MKVVYCANRAIYHLLPTAINSLLSNNQGVEKIYLLIEDDSIDCITHPKIEFINCNQFDFLIRDGFNCTCKFPYMAMVRCFLTKIISESKIIYLDVDTIVDSSLSELWNYNTGGCCIAAREEENGYFNSGVMLFNLSTIKALHLDDKLIKILKNCRFVFPDQDAMNIIFKNKVAYLPHKFNAIGRDYEVKDKEIAIRHYAGVIKPWRNGATEFDKEYWEKYRTDYIIESEVS